MIASYATASDQGSSEKCFDVSAPVGHFPVVYEEYEQYIGNRTE
jgi:hypothetical protein